MAAINYKLNFCRITLASRLFVRNNYFPLFKVLTPQDATREIIKNTFTPKNHYMPVLLSHKKRDRLSGGKKIKELKNYGKRLHSRIDDFKYMSVILNTDDDKHKKILDILKSKKSIKGNYVYKIEERSTCLVFNGQLEEAARNGDIADITISDNTDKMIMRLKSGEKITAEAKTFLLEELLLWGEAATTADTESRHHYGKMIMSIAHIFEMKERCAALYELEKMKFEAQKKQRVEREWKCGMEPLLENLVRENEANKENEQSNNELEAIEKTEYKMNIADMGKTLHVSDRLMNAGVEEIQKLPLMKEINRMVKRLGEGKFTEMVGMPGVVVKVGDNERFLVGQMVQTEKEKIFVPGQTFETTNGVKYLPGITVNLDNIPTFIAGIIMADDSNTAVFLPGQSFITTDGKMKFTKEGERVTPVGMKKLQMTEDEQWERVEKRKLAREKIEREKMEKQKLETKERKRAKVKKEKLDRKRAEKAARLEKERQEKEKQLELERLETTQITPLVVIETIETPEHLIDSSGENHILQTSPHLEPLESLEQLEASSTEMEIEPPTSMPQESEILHHLNDDILAGIFSPDPKHFIDEEQIENDIEVAEAKMEEERKKNAVIDEEMREVLDALEMKKTELLEKLWNIQNETSIYEDRAITYIYPAKANAIAVELGFDGQIARNIAKILLGITKWASTFSAKFHIQNENIDIVSYSSEIDEDFFNCSDNLKSALKASMVAAVEVFKFRPQDLEGGMRAAGNVLAEAVDENVLIVDEMALTLENKTISERNALFSSTRKDLTKLLVVNKAETLRSIIREEFIQDKFVANMNLVIEEEGNMLVRAFTNLANDNTELIKKVHTNIMNTAPELICENKSAEAAHRAIVDAVQELADFQLNKYLTTESTQSIRNLLLEGKTLSDIVGMKNESKTINKLLEEEDDELSFHVLATDQITLDILRRVLIIRQLAALNPQLMNGLALLRKEPYQAKDDGNVRELIRESAALISYACPILSSMDIPSFLFDLDNNLAMEDFLVQHMKQDGALLISKKGIQAVVPKEASRFVLSGLISYTLIDDKGVTTFKPMHVFNALKLGKQKELKYHDYSCVGAFDKYAYSVPGRESLDYNTRNYNNTFYNNNCRDDVCLWQTSGGASGPEAEECDVLPAPATMRSVAAVPPAPRA